MKKKMRRIRVINSFHHFMVYHKKLLNLLLQCELMYKNHSIVDCMIWCCYVLYIYIHIHIIMKFYIHWDCTSRYFKLKFADAYVYCLKFLLDFSSFYYFYASIYFFLLFMIFIELLCKDRKINQDTTNNYIWIVNERFIYFRKAIW